MKTSFLIVLTMTFVTLVSCNHQSHQHSSHNHKKEKHLKHHPRAARNRREDVKVVKDSNSDAKPTTVQPNKNITTAVPDQTYCTTDAQCSSFNDTICIENKCDCSKEELVKVLEPYGCYEGAELHTKCIYHEQCKAMIEESRCNLETKVCECMEGYKPDTYGTDSDISFTCIKIGSGGSTNGVDPAMIGVLVGLGLMFVIICVVLRLFSKARFRETRSIFNTPNPRLMNASLFKDSRRGSCLSTASATGGAGHAGARRPSRVSKSPSPSSDSKKQETTVAIESVD